MLIEKRSYKGIEYEVHYDDNPESPRKWDNYDTVLFFGRKQDCGDKHIHKLDANDYSGWKELKAAIVKKYDAKVVLPVYMYSHSGETISTSPFCATWDSGQVGFIIATPERIAAMNGWKRVSKVRLEKLKTYLESEIETLDAYINGDVFGFVIDSPGIGESVWGYFDKEDMIAEIESIIDYHTK